MSKVIHDYKGKNVYHLIRDGKRYEFKIQALWAEVYSDVHPTAVGVRVMCTNPQIIPVGQHGRQPIEFVVYVDKLEVEFIDELLKTLFDYLAVILWQTKVIGSTSSQIIANEATHFNNAHLAPPPIRWRAPELFGTLSLVSSVRVRLNLMPEELPTMNGLVTVSGLAQKATHKATMALKAIESKVAMPFYVCTVSTFMRAFMAKEIA